MHFVIGANVDDSNTTGMGRQMHGLGQALQDNGHKVEYIFADQLGVSLGRKLSRIEAPLRLAAALKRIARAASSPPIAILHEPVAWATAVLARRQVCTLTMVHACEMKGWSFTVATRHETGEQIKPLSRIVWPATELTQTYASLRLADGVLCLSTTDLQYIVNRIGVNRRRIARIDNGLEPAFLGLPLDDSARTRDILFLGSWLPRKGIRTLVAALEKVAAAGLDPSLTLAGTGLGESEVRAQLPAPWQTTAQVLPHVPADQLVDVYRQHKIFALPSVAEGIPLVILEAMACGLCLVVTDVGGVADVVDNGSTGWVVPPLDADAFSAAIVRALRNPVEARQLAQSAHAKMQLYGWSRVAKQVEIFVRSIRGDSGETC
jgi:glycosyltransferase involved in cell wall biosynthesis